MSEFAVRTVDREELASCLAVHESAFGIAIDGEIVKQVASETEFDRTYAAFDGSRVVATAKASSFTLTVPGGEVDMAGLGSAAVLPSHHRRGLLAELTRRRFDQARERGDAVAAIWASEAIRRGRWQFGCATIGCELELTQPYMSCSTGVGTSHPAKHAAEHSAQETRACVTLVSRDDALSVIPPIHDDVRARLPGMIDRSQPRWNNWLDADPWHWLGHGWRRDVSPRIFAVWKDNLGYVVYRLQRRWIGGAAEYRVLIAELMALDLDAYVGLWSWCFGLDLVRSMRASQRPVDEVLPLLLDDPRRLKVRQTDALRIRPLDVRRAMAARTYACDGALTVEIIDAAGPWAAGRYHLTVDGGQSTCTPAASIPDVVLPAETLGSIYLGGASIARLTRAGLASEHTLGAIDRLDLMLRVDPTPWCTTVF